ncbi:MAG: NAD(P)/FAD-dependent oxidoreductase [Rhodobacteraceae bacterium]|jgi:sulfide:quinone oxidoreductase|nr:NAD(P)/FAD-dependent oxidoreductase [Paracoccaceae bacterium]
MTIDRRTFLATAAGAAAIGAGAMGRPARAQRVPTSARIVILGAGAAGTAMANRLDDMLDGAQITLIDGRPQHWYQPGFTLIAAGLKPADYSVSRTAQWLPRRAEWIEDKVAEIDPDAKRVTTAGGQSVDYDFLVVATGLDLRFDEIEGFSLDLVGSNGIGAVYAGPDYAARSWAELDRFTERGGEALFFRPATEMKCAGAPLKYTFITDDYARRKGTRGKTNITYAAHSGSLFGVPIVNEKVRMLFHERGVAVAHNHVLRAIDPGAQVATFETPDGMVDLPYDFTNVIPPMRAPRAVMDSPLSWKTGKWADQGWVEADPYTMRSVTYPDVFAVGDVAGVPKGKTAASVKWQVPVAADHIVAAIQGQESDAVYNGYTSCPLITRIGRAMLIEFDYENNLVPSFPGVIAPLEELWISWLMKEIALKATYNAMLRGRA